MNRLRMSRRRISAKFSLSLVAMLTLTFSARAFEPTISVSITTPSTPVFYGTTNLPDGANLMLTLTGLEVSYAAQSKMAVKNGKFQSERLTFQGAPLIPGRYKIEILMVAAALNPTNVQAVTGAYGEKMTGKWVTRGVIDEREFHYTALVNLGGPASESGPSAAGNSVAAARNTLPKSGSRTQADRVVRLTCAPTPSDPTGTGPNCAWRDEMVSLDYNGIFNLEDDTIISLVEFTRFGNNKRCSKLLAARLGEPRSIPKRAFEIVCYDDESPVGFRQYNFDIHGDFVNSEIP